MTVIPLYVSKSRFERKLPIKPAAPVTRTVLFSNEISAIEKRIPQQKKNVHYSLQRTFKADFFSIPATDFQILSVLLISTETMKDFTYDSMLRKKFPKFYILFFKFY